MDTPDGTAPQTTSTQDGSTALGAAFWAGTALAALLGSAVGVFFILTLGLVVNEYVVFPLALGVAAILTSLAAGWAGNWLAANHTRTKLLRVVGVTEAVALVLAIVFVASAALRVVLLGPVLYLGLFCAATLALTATLATARFRSRETDPNDGRTTLLLLVLAIASVPVVIVLAWLAGMTGA